MPTLYHCPRCGKYYRADYETFEDTYMVDEEAVAEVLREPVERGLPCSYCCRSLIKITKVAKRNCKRLQ